VDENSQLQDPSAYAGAPDGFDRLWTPHRMVYIQGENKPESAGAGECPFCRIQAGSDENGLIVHRDQLVFAVLNLYPYSPGHLLICPYRHVADYTELTPAEMTSIGTLTGQAMSVIRRVSDPHGFNLGINQGAVAGAGIAAHLHQHVVPRWRGDANFLPVVGQTKALPELLGQTWGVVSRAWRDTTSNQTTGQD
jgi:ATP adenylyltransferase